jgi:hypothetical protein
MDIAKSLTYQFEDPEWLAKMIVGGVVVLLGLLLTPIIIGLALLFILNGYMIEVIRNVMNGVEHPMPGWEKWGEWFSSGLKIFILELVWAIPAILFSLFGKISQMVAEGHSTAAAIGTLFVLIFGLLNLAWDVILLLVMPAIMVKFSKTEEMAAGFDFPFIFDFVQKEIVNIVIAAVVLIVAWVVGTIAGVVLCFIGLFPAMFWLGLVEAHLYGQIGKDYFEKLEPTVPAEMPQE